MREFRSRGSVRGAVGNDRPYREHVARASGTYGLPITADIPLHRTSRRGGPGYVKTSVREDLVEFKKFPYLLTRMIAASYQTRNIK